MATWKKVIVSGSNANLASLQVDGLTSGQVVIGGGSGSVLTTTAINGTGNIVATTGATSVSHSGSFSGSFQGSLNSVLAQGSQPNFVAYDTATGTFTYSGTGSFTATSASFASTASYTPNAFISASSNNTTTITFAKGDGSTLAVTVNSASYAANAQQATSASYASTATSASYSATSQQATSASYASTAQQATSASYASNATSASYAANAQQATSASYASFAVTGNGTFSGSFSGSFQGDGSQLTGLATTLDISGSTGNGSVNLLTQDLTITGTANEIETSVSGQTVTIGLPNNVTVASNLTVGGDLTVAGTASFVNTENLNIKDKFILINSGSSTLADSGWITQYNAAGSGSAFFLEANSAGTYGRFAMAYDVLGTANSVAANEYVVSAKSTAGAPAATPTWGGTTNGFGNMHVDSTTGDIYIYA